MTDKRFCYYVVETQDASEHGGFVPSLVIEGEEGHSPMVGDSSKLQAPWVWGDTLAQAQEIAGVFNKRLGLTIQDVDRIVASSMFHKSAPVDEEEPQPTDSRPCIKCGQVLTLHHPADGQLAHDDYSYPDELCTVTL